MKCRACKVEMEREEAMAHYQGSFHIENLRRKEIGMESISKEAWEGQSGNAPAISGDMEKEEDQRAKEEIGTHALQNGECFFCGAVLDVAAPCWTDLKYINHLETHGFYFIAEKYIVDFSGLMEYLREKVSECVCMYCNKRFSHISKARSHMMSMDHMRYSQTTEYDAFYEYPEQETAQISEDGTELTLPTGRVVGHKKYQRYYSQVLREENYYMNMDQIHLKFRKEQLQRKTVPETDVERMVKQKESERVRKDTLKVSKGRNCQKHYREDWMQ